MASSNGNLTVVQALLSHPSTNVSVLNRWNRTALHEACAMCRGSADIVDCLLLVGMFRFHVNLFINCCNFRYILWISFNKYQYPHLFLFIVKTLFIQSFVHLLTITSKVETLLQDFVVILKCSLQNYYKIVNKYILYISCLIMF